jgi:hypothetical protein
MWHDDPQGKVEFLANPNHNSPEMFSMCAPFQFEDLEAKGGRV